MKARTLNMEEVYEALIGVALQGQPLSNIQDYVDPHFMGYGTAEDETLTGWEGLKWMIERQRKEMEKSSMTLTRHPILTTTLGHDDNTLVVEEFKFNLTTKEGPHSFMMRLSTILAHNNGQWMIRHFHGSIADADTPEGDAWPIEEWKRRNAELQQLVEEKTKELSAQNKELEIEAALERVRAVAMSMRTPEELQQVGEVVFSELKALGFGSLRNTEIIINRDEKQSILSYYYSDYGVSGQIEVDYTTHPILKKWAEDLKTAGDGFAGVHISESEIEEWIKYREELGYKPDPQLDEANTLDYYSYSTGLGALSISSFEPITTEQLSTLERFKNVFALAYRRYVDVVNAEAQAGEAQIEASLERVRARTMAMHSSEELAEVAQVLFDQMKLLGGELFAFGIVLCDKHENMVEQWHSLGDAGMMSPFLVPIDLDYIHRYRYVQWQARVEVFSIEIPSDYIARHFELMFELPSVMAAKEELAAKGIEIEAPPWEIDYGASFRYGYLLVSSLQPFAEEHIFPRFAKVFEQAYTRFLDLQKAEAQSREAQIEAALERVRAQTMAMHSSEDVGECTVKMFGELTALGVDEDTRFGIGILNKENENNQLWTASKEGKEVKLHIGNLDMTLHPLLKSARKAWKEQVPLHTYVLEGEDLLNYYQMIKDAPDYKIEIDIDILPERELHYGFTFDHGFFYAFNPREFQPDLIQIIQRFSSLFGQTYRRYLDLVKAEAQAREAQIEAALERVRAASMAMHKTDELVNVVTVASQQFQELGIDIMLVYVGIYIYSLKEKYVDQWFSPIKGIQEEPFYIKLPSELWENTTIKDWRDGKEMSYVSVHGDQAILQYAKAVDTMANSNLFEQMHQKYAIKVLEQTEANHKYGNLGIIQDRKATQAEQDILKRFAKVFEQTYTRFLDLQKAEEQAREAQIEVALERVRAASMAMHQSVELVNVATIVYNQLLSLGFDSVVSGGFNFPDEEKNITKCWFADTENEGLLQDFEIPYDGDPVLDERKNYRKKNIPFLEQVLHKEELKKHMEYVFPVPTASEEESGAREAMPDPTVFSIQFLSWGYVILISTESLDEEQKSILSRLASAFNLAYTRFLDLQKAEAQTREAQIEAALEKVRSSSLAVNKVDEFNDVVTIVFEKLSEFDIPVSSVTIAVVQEQPKDFDVFGCGESEAGLTTLKFGLPYFSNPLMDDLIQERMSTEVGYFSKVYSEKEKNIYYDYALKNTELKNLPDDIKQRILSCTSYGLSTALARNSMIMINDMEGNVLDEGQADIVKRFSTVFEQAYIRFLDIQKAEAQVREAQIEVALERTRNQSMLMQHSDELNQVSNVFHEQLLELGLPSEFSYVWLPDEENETHLFWATWSENNKVASSSRSKAITYPLDKTEPYTAACFEMWESNENVFVNRIQPEEVEGFFTTWSELVGDAENLKAKNFPDGLYYAEAYMKYGCFGINVRRSLTDEEQQILQRFSIEFERAYTRFLDLQKAEAQAREAQIEVALERVRAKSMAMHKSEDLADLSLELVKQVHNLGIETWFCAFNINDGDEKGGLEWGSNGQGVFPKYRTPREGIFLEYYNAGQSGETLFIREIDEDECPVHYEYLCTLPGVGEQLLKIKEAGIPFPTYQIDHVAFFKYGYILFITFEPVPESHDIFKRFAIVFEQTYTRFLDLQKAETQAREAQIETALERVRSRTMGMQKSEELKEVIQILFNQFVHLEIFVQHTGFIIDYKSRDDMLIWLADENAVFPQISIPYFDSPHWNSFVEAKEKRRDLFTNLLNFEEKNRFYKKLFTYIPDLTEETKDYYFQCPGLAISTVLLDNVGLYIENFEGNPYSDEENNILLRFGQVFQQAYTRFLDLQKAESQVKEAKIEAALEKIRSRTMAMQSSNELPEAANLLFLEIQALGIPTWSAGYNILSADKKSAECWMSSEGAMQPPFTLYFKKEKSFIQQYNFFCSDESFLIQELSGKALQQHYDYMKSIPKIGEIIIELENSGISLPTHQINHLCKFELGYLLFITYEPVPDAHELFKRFTNVFEQTYTRFLDLQKAEAQAREAQIEAALEKVRSRTMGMQKSEELPEVAHVLFLQIQSLGISTWSAGYNILSEDKKSSTCIMSSEGQIQSAFHLPLTGEKSFQEWHDAIHQTEPIFVQELGGKALEEHYQYLFSLPDIQQAIDPLEEAGISFPTYQINHLSFFQHGFLLFITYEKVPKVHDIFKRFTVVFEQTYTRFIDLQNAEAQAREAKIEAALEKVRSRTMAMHKANELHEVVTVVVEKLMDLGVILDANGVILCTYFPDSRDVLHWIASPDFSFTGSYLLPYFDHPIFSDAWESKLSGVEYFSKSFSVEEKNSFFEYAFEHSDYKHFPDEFKQWVFQNDKHSLSFAWSENSAILIPSHTGVLPSEEDVEILKRFAKVFEQAYVRFMDLQTAEEQAVLIKEERDRLDATLKDLKSTQSQLIHSEKMASLGELTAGIAHEIQNPLNFVNNFSEVSGELVQEAKEEIEKGELKEAAEILTDLTQNLEKITHHGGRASSIVKGMLDHSRTSKGEKELADINDLCDEYLRLAYHGMRAKDKSFNASFETHFDENLSKINIIPQDIGRVVLNIINNAFQAVSSEALAKESTISQPGSDNQINESTDKQSPGLVMVSTSQMNNLIQISISDNGPGIPDHIKDKIFQPFFTTKPTGSGTGLGLSLSYDIVKAHGGDIQVESQMGQGTTFFITLPTRSV